MSLLERESALRVAADYLADAGAGDGRVTFVAGETGKTVFVDAVVEQAGTSRTSEGIVRATSATFGRSHLQSWTGLSRGHDKCQL